MNFAGNQVQIFSSLAVILTAATIALVCDYLKRKNDELRDQIVELRAERHHTVTPQVENQAPVAESKMVATPAPQNADQPARKEISRVALAVPALGSTAAAVRRTEEPESGSVMVEAAPEAPKVVANSVPGTRQGKRRPMVARDQQKRMLAPEAMAAMQRGAELAARQAGPLGAAGSVNGQTSTAAERLLAKERQAAAQKKTEELEQREAMLMAALTGAAKMNRRSSETVMPEMATASSPAITEPVATIHASAEIASVEASLPPVTVTLESAFGTTVVRSSAANQAIDQTLETPKSKKNWAALLDKNVQQRAQRSSKSAARPASITQPETGIDLNGVPSGFHDGYVLSRLVQSHHPVTGLVISIGVNLQVEGAARGTEKAAQGMQAVKDLMQSLIGPTDFACQSGDDEFLLIYPRERGASAQKKLSQVAERLWDFQIKSLGELSILFSWGGVEVASESIDEAILAASERMLETKRSRKNLTIHATRATQPVREALAQAV
jgi:GGDEF domain-containing protein